LLANALWLGKAIPILPAFVQAIRDGYRAECRNLDFGDSAGAARIINTWVADNTRARIQNLISPTQLNADTALVLTNAIYFKGDWLSKFEKSDTRDEPFTCADGRKVPAPFMRQTDSFIYAHGEGVALLEMPYADERLSMVILLPDEPDGIGALESALTPERLAGHLAGLSRQTVQVIVPRFKLTTQYDLIPTLQAIGMKDAFGRKADFSGISTTRDPHITAVVHKAFVQVDEEGTEAAAATGVAIGVTSMAPRRDPPLFRADHPFVFLIRDMDSGMILFIGRLTDPAN
jgi:serpin B